MKTPSGYVALRKGRQVRNCIFLSWCDAEVHIKDFDGAEYSIIDTLKEAEKYIISSNNFPPSGNDNTLDNESVNTNIYANRKAAAPSPPPLPPDTVDIDTEALPDGDDALQNKSFNHDEVFQQYNESINQSYSIIDSHNRVSATEETPLSKANRIATRAFVNENRCNTRIADSTMQAMLPSETPIHVPAVGTAASTSKSALEKATTSTDKKIGKKWKIYFDKLATYRKPDGTYPQPIPDLHVRTWLHTQIYEYRKKLVGRKSSLHDEKEQLLRSIGVNFQQKISSSQASRNSLLNQEVLEELSKKQTDINHNDSNSSSNNEIVNNGPRALSFPQILPRNESTVAAVTSNKPSEKATGNNTTAGCSPSIRNQNKESNDAILLSCTEQLRQDSSSETSPKIHTQCTAPSECVILQAWKDNLAKLQQYMDQNNGDWNVKSEDDPELNTWILDQQAQYLCMKQGKQSFMNEEKLILLQEIGVDFDNNLSSFSERIAESTSHTINKKGGIYKLGAAYTLEKKLELVSLLEKLRSNPSKRKHGVSARSLAKAANVSIGFASKVIKEVDGNGILDPKQYTRKLARGAGVRKLAEPDEIVLLRLRRQNPKRSLQDYVYWLDMITGTKVSINTIKSWFHSNFPYKGNIKKGNQHPLEEFTVITNELYWKFLETFRLSCLSKIKFCDEKHLKGSKIFKSNSRSESLTGIIPYDFRNNYTIISFCGIDESLPAIDFTINKCTANNASVFYDAIDAAVVRKFLKEGDVLVIDSAVIQGYCESVNLEEFLWDCYGIIVVKVKLVTQSPDLNPFHLVWNTLIERLRHFSFNDPRKDAFAHAVTLILEQMNHAEIKKYFMECKYI